MHRLLEQKTAMDAVNEQLLDPSQYPGADKEYASPFYFKGTEPQDEQLARRSSLKNADIKQHREPRVLPPRQELRSHMDDEVKKELQQDLQMDKAGKLDTESIQLTPEQDKCWQEAFEYYADMGYSEVRAVRMADREAMYRCPDLAKFHHWVAPVTTTPTA